VTETDEWVRTILSNVGTVPGPETEGDVLIELRYRVGFLPKRMYHADKYEGIWTCRIGKHVLYDLSLEKILRQALLWSKEQSVLGKGGVE
jgi:hypothetical protein